MLPHTAQTKQKNLTSTNTHYCCTVIDWRLTNDKSVYKARKISSTKRSGISQKIQKKKRNKNQTSCGKSRHVQLSSMSVIDPTIPQKGFPFNFSTSQSYLIRISFTKSVHTACNTNGPTLNSKWKNICKLRVAAGYIDSHSACLCIACGCKSNYLLKRIKFF